MAAKKITDFTPFFTKISLARKPSPIRELMPLVTLPGMISLGGGMPNIETFPLQKASLTLKDGTVLEVDKDRMNMALQYSETPGLKPLVAWLAELQKAVHAPQNPTAICMSTGSQDILSKSFEMLIEKGDDVLCEGYTYSGSLSTLVPLGCNLVGVDTDAHGLIPSLLKKRLADLKANSKKPRVLYTIPTGSNPTGGSMTLDRKREVYSLAQEHNLIILEDDPYYYLQFGPRSQSLMSMDTDGRVLRFDSFSKIISSGLRLGWATGPAPLIERLNLHMQATSLHPSGLSQVVLLTILENMKLEGFLKHTNNVSAFYKKRMEAFQAAAKKHLTGLAEWNTPSAGMFCWIKLLGVEDSFSLIKEKAVKEKVLLVPGGSFSATGGKSPYVRASFSTATPEQMDEALRRLAVLLKGQQIN